MKEKSAHYKKLKRISTISSIAIITFSLIIPVLIASFMENIAIIIIDILLSVFVAYMAFCIGRGYIDYVVLEKCDFYAYQLYLAETKNLGRFKKTRMKTEIAQLNTYLALGWYDKAFSSIEELKRRWEDLSDIQKLQIDVIHINCIAETAPQLLEQFIAQFYERLGAIGQASLDKKILGQLELIVRLKRSLFQKEWEEAVVILEKIERKNIYQQVASAYWMGICQLKLGRYDRAAQELMFVSQYGGNTKYVLWAKENLTECRVQNIGNEGEKPFRKYKRNILLYIVAALLFIGVGRVVNHFPVYSGNVEQAYRWYYSVSAKKEVSVLYEEDIDDWKLAIVCEGSKVTYCLLEQKDGEGRYRIVDTFETDTVFLQLGQKEKTLNLTKEESEIVDKAMAEIEIERVINEFYIQNEVLKEKSAPYVGVYCSSVVEKLKLGNQIANVKSVAVNNELFYLWKIDNAGYWKITEEDIEIP